MKNVLFPISSSTLFFSRLCSDWPLQRGWNAGETLGGGGVKVVPTIRYQDEVDQDELIQTNCISVYSQRPPVQKQPALERPLLGEQLRTQLLASGLN